MKGNFLFKKISLLSNKKDVGISFTLEQNLSTKLWHWHYQQFGPDILLF